jgi:tryptophan-rich sensory protein
MTIVSRRELGWLLGFVGASFSAAAVGALFTTRSLSTWYRTLRKPTWTPPDAVFGPVWTVLYGLIGLSGWLVQRQVLRKPTCMRAAELARRAWVAQLLLNVAWSATFFGWRRPGGGLAVIIVLWAAIAACAGLSARVSGVAGVLLLPYLVWTAFAALLNGRIWQLNRPHSHASPTTVRKQARPRG